MTPEQLARLYYTLFNERRLDEARELVDPQAQFRYVPTKQFLVGRAGYRALAAMWLNAFEDARIEITSLRVVNDHVVEVEILGRGTHTGDLVLGETLTVPATDRAARLSFRETLDIRNGRIVSSRLDFDVEELKRRLL